MAPPFWAALLFVGLEQGQKNTLFSVQEIFDYLHVCL
jgi:hypothetical protein